MVMIIKFLIVAFLLAILVSLGRGLFYLLTDKGESKRLANTLTVRIALSIALVVLIGAAYAFGFIQPHGVLPQ